MVRKNNRQGAKGIAEVPATPTNPVPTHPPLAAAARNLSQPMAPSTQLRSGPQSWAAVVKHGAVPASPLLPSRDSTHATRAPAIFRAPSSHASTMSISSINEVVNTLSGMSLSINKQTSLISQPPATTQSTNAVARPVTTQAGRRRHRGKVVTDPRQSVPGVQHRAPLMNFHPFSRLPVELRLKVWQLAAANPRLIEMEWGPNLDEATGIRCGSHQWRRVCPRSRKPPAILHVNQESRYEALSIYSLRSFDAYTSGWSDIVERYIYFNNNADILYFGENTCTSTLIKVFTACRNEPIKKVAIHMSGKIEQCCNHDDYTYSVEGGVSTMQALHGFDPEVTIHDYRFAGCTGLQEVIFVVKTKIWARGPGEIDDQCILLPTESDGVISGQARFKQRLLHDIERVDSGVGVYANGGRNVWAGGDKPSFSFASIRPLTVGNDPTVRDGIAVSKAEMRKLMRKNWEFFKALEPRA